MDIFLKPFPGEKTAPALRISAAVSRKETILEAKFLVEGDLYALEIPSQAANPERKARLWEETCLELFLAPCDCPAYYEFNLSPSGHWNIYRFDSYRKGMREEESIPAPLLWTVRNAEALRFSFEADIGNILPKSAQADIGISAVLRSVEGDLTHWAPTHPASRPDFHHKDGFILKI